MIDLQKERLLLAQGLSSKKNKAEKNKFGQYATPSAIADEIVKYALNQIQSREIRFLEPGFGTGSFFSSLLNNINNNSHCLESAKGFEIDPIFYKNAQSLYKNTKLEIELNDFTTANPQEYNLILCNPPYVRHQHLNADQKIFLVNEVNKKYDIKLSGYTGLYNYFMILGEDWLSYDGISSWLVPSEFLDTNYGVHVKKFLLNKVTITKIHLYASENLQFDDALVSSAIIFYKKGKATSSSTLEISYGGSLINPNFSKAIRVSDLNENEKWTRLIKKWVLNKSKFNIEPKQNKIVKTLKDYFDIKRGIATGNNSFFILSDEHVKELSISPDMLLPILPSSRYLKTDVIESDENGFPTNTTKLFLLNCKIQEEDIKNMAPTTWSYLKSGIGTVDQTYLCKNRKVWYFQETRDPAPIICTYMGRGGKRPFRFILNKSNAIATNSYLMLYPKAELSTALIKRPELINDIWDILNKITSDDLISEGRTYGGGLEKLEPSELGNVPVSGIIDLLA